MAPVAGTLGQELAQGAAPGTRSDAGYWLLFAVLGFVVGQVVAGILLMVAASVTGNSSDLAAISRLAAPPTWYIASSLVGLWVGFLGASYLGSFVKGTKNLVADLGLRFRPIDLLGVPIGVASQYGIVLLYKPIAQHVSNFNQKFDGPAVRLTGGSHGTNFLLVAILTVVGAPIVEEIFFRGLLLRGLGRACEPFGRVAGPTVAIVATGLLFGLVHAESLQLLGLAVFGVVLSVCAWRTGRLAMGIFAHVSFNFVAVVAVVLPVLR